MPYDNNAALEEFIPLFNRQFLKIAPSLALQDTHPADPNYPTISCSINTLLDTDIKIARSCRLNFCTASFQPSKNTNTADFDFHRHAVGMQKASSDDRAEQTKSQPSRTFWKHPSQALGFGNDSRLSLDLVTQTAKVLGLNARLEPIKDPRYTRCTIHKSNADPFCFLQNFSRSDFRFFTVRLKYAAVHTLKTTSATQIVK